MNTIQPREQYIILYGSSHLALISLVFAFYKRHYLISAGVGSIFITSVNYWRKPDHSWRRTLDMTVSSGCIVCQHILAYNAEYARQYYIIYFMALAAFLIGKEYHKKGELWKSTYSHLAFHILCNTANIVLYSGYINA